MLAARGAHGCRYTLVAEVVDNVTGSVLDTVNTTVGIRSLDYTAVDGMFINGKHIKVKVMYHDSIDGQH